SWIGVGIKALPEDKSKMFYPADHGVIVVQVTPGSPAQKAGVQPGDIILEVDGKAVKAEKDLISVVSGKPSGTKVDLLVSREGQKKALTMRVEPRPEQATQAEDGQEEGAEAP
ncbi:MAG TPA: PDZ domain-containing protein, partial [Chroococcales cyanobacterium]